LGGSTGGIAENSTGDIFVGTIEDGFTPPQIFKSTDNGENWSPSDSGIAWGYAEAMVISNNDYMFFSGYATGVYRSTDNGEYWEKLNNNYSYEDIYSLLVSDNDYIFAGIADNISLRIVRSTDYGETWVNLSSGIDDPVYSLASYQNNIYVGTSGSGVYYSTDYGGSWVHSSLDTSYNRALAVNDSGNVFAGSTNGELFRSNDSGVSWDKIYDIGENSISSILTSVPGYIFVGCVSWNSVGYGKIIFRSTDDGITWDLVNNGLLSERGIVKLIYTDDGSIYATSSDNGVFRSSDFGDTWEQVGPIISNLNEIIIDEEDYVFAATQYKIYRSSNGGISWEYKGNGIEDTYIPALAANINGDIWAGSEFHGFARLYHSTDKGESWTKIPGFGHISIESIDNNSSGDIFVATGNYLVCSTDNGLTWQQKHPQSFGTLFITDDDEIYFGHRYGLEASYNNGNNWTEILQANYIKKIYVDKKHNIFAASNDGLLRSSNNGISWDTVSTKFITPYVSAITGNSTNQLYCTVQGSGLYAYYASYDDGINWLDITEDMTSPGLCLAIDSKGYLYTGAEHRGVFKSNKITTKVKSNSSSPLNYSLLQNYPNPFNPTTVISYQIKRQGFVTLKIFDVLGKEIATLVNEEKPAGKYEVDFSDHGLASGVYIYRMKVNDFIESKKMLLLR